MSSLFWGGMKMPTHCLCAAWEEKNNDVENKTPQKETKRNCGGGGVDTNAISCGIGEGMNSLCVRLVACMNEHINMLFFVNYTKL